MKTKIILALIPSLMIILTIGACKKESECVDGNGDYKIDTRQPGDFNRIVSNGAFNINYSQTNSTSVDVFAESNILPIIQTTVTDQTLIIQVQDDGCYNAQQPVEVTLTSPDLKAVTLNGSETYTANNLKLDNLDMETTGSAMVNSSLDLNELTVTLSGSGNYTLVGSANTSRFNIPGSGNIFASVFVTDSCEVILSGSGDIHIYVTKYLKVMISGSGSVYYKGNPGEIDSTITGSGELINEGK